MKFDQTGTSVRITAPVKVCASSNAMMTSGLGSAELRGTAFSSLSTSSCNARCPSVCGLVVVLVCFEVLVGVGASGSEKGVKISLIVGAGALRLGDGGLNPPDARIWSEVDERRITEKENWN